MAMANPRAVKKKRKYNLVGYAFIFPAMFFFCFYILYPIIFVGYHSIFEWATLSNMKFVGLDNFKKLFSDPVFWTTIQNAVIWILVTVPVQACLGFFLAYVIEDKLLNGKSGVLRGAMRTAFFFPVVVSVTVVAIVWSKIFQPYQGIIGYYAKMLFGYTGTINILGDPSHALLGTMIANIWEWTGWSMIMYVAGLSQISEDMKEAARIDGASTWQMLRYVILPALSSVHKSLLMLGVIGSLQTYALIAVMTSGGPNHASEMPATYIFMKGFTEKQMGYACAISVGILVLALILTVIQVVGIGSGDFMKKEEG